MTAYSYRFTLRHHTIEGHGPYRSPIHTLTLPELSCSRLRAYVIAFSICFALKMTLCKLTDVNPIRFTVRCTRMTSSFIWEGGHEILS